MAVINCAIIGLIESIMSDAISPNTDFRPAAWADLVNQSANLYKIDEYLYRSEQLVAEDIAVLKEYGIDTIINLRFFDRDEDEENLQHQPFHLINHPLMTWAIKPAQLAAILYDILWHQARGNKVLVHCYHGSDRTGITIAMYRILVQNWTIEHAKIEMQEGGYGFHWIWINISNLLTDAKVQEVHEALLALQRSQPITNKR